MNRDAGFVAVGFRCVAVAFALAVLGVAGCSSKHLTPEQKAQAEVEACEAQIRKVVADPARAEQLVALTNQLQQQMRESVAVAKGYRAKLAVLNANYEATRQDYEALFRQQEAQREALVRKVAALRERMAALTTDAEWQQVDKASQRMLNADLQDLVS